MDFGIGLIAFSLVLILPFASCGSLLPTWMFINTLQLLAHLPLLNSSMPANAHHFLKGYLDMVRWYDKDFIDDVENSLDSKKYDVEFGSFHELLKACDYEHLISHNMFLIFAGLALICAVWLILAVKDLLGRVFKFKRPCMRRRHES